jgi:hypothetical protein
MQQRLDCGVRLLSLVFWFSSGTALREETGGTEHLCR